MVEYSRMGKGGSSLIVFGTIPVCGLDGQETGQQAY